MSRRISMHIACAAMLLPVAIAAAAPRQTAGVAVWLTSADRSSLVAEQPTRLAFTKPVATTGVVIDVDPFRRFQQMDGFGFALTGGSAELLMRMSPERRAALLKELFGTGNGSIGVSYLRVSVGASDMNSRVFTYDDLPAGETDSEVSKFSLGPDLADVVPVLKEILAINPKIAILASPWTAPSWMKTNGLPKGGSLDPKWYGAYANYFVDYLQAMASHGIAIRALTIQNEPLNPKNTPSMVMTAKEEATFLSDALGPALRKAGLKTEVILYDHNCDRPDYPLDILANTSAAQYATGSGFHLYGGTIDAMSRMHDEHPDKALYFTEQMVVDHENDETFKIAESVSRLMIGAPRNWSRNVLLWNLAADPKFGPHTTDGGCPVCQGAITLDGDQVTRNLAFYTVAQVSQFVRPGAVRIGSDTSDNATLPNVAFETPDHRTVLLVANTGKSEQTFTVKDRKQMFTARLRAGDVATFVWP